MASTGAGAAMAAALPFELSRLFQAPDGPARDDAWANFVAAHSRLLLHVARSLSPDHDAAMDGYTYVLERLREDLAGGSKATWPTAAASSRRGSWLWRDVCVSISTVTAMAGPGTQRPMPPPSRRRAGGAPTSSPAERDQTQPRRPSPSPPSPARTRTP